jgi:hypothetical protein
MKAQTKPQTKPITQDENQNQGPRKQTPMFSTKYTLSGRTHTHTHTVCAHPTQPALYVSGPATLHNGSW